MAKKLQNAKVSVYTGNKGGGKSIFAIYDSLPFFASGATVYVNFLLRFDPLKELVAERYGVEIVPEQIQRLPDDFANFRDHLKKGLDGQHNLLILDEAHLDYSQEDQRLQATKRADDQRFISHARKSKIEVFFISQDFRNLDVKFRRQTQQHIYHYSFNDMAFFGPAIAVVIPNWHRRTYSNVLGGEIVTPSMDSKLKKRPTEIYPLYDTDEMFGYDLESEERRELKTVKPKSKRSLIMKILIVIILALVTVTVVRKCKSDPREDKQTMIEKVAEPSRSPVTLSKQEESRESLSETAETYRAGRITYRGKDFSVTPYGLVDYDPELRIRFASTTDMLERRLLLHQYELDIASVKRDIEQLRNESQDSNGQSGGNVPAVQNAEM